MDVEVLVNLNNTRSTGIILFKGSVPIPNVREKQREARRKIIRQWAKLPKDKRQSMEGIFEFARTAAQQNENAFVRIRRDPYQKVMGWLLPRAHL